MQDYKVVLDFWFAEENKDKHFAKDAIFDERIRTQFYQTWQAACRGELADWRKDIKGRVAEIIVLDQFSRNLFRTSGEAFRQDVLALVLAQETIKQEEFASLASPLQVSALMPFMHAESQVIQEESVRLFSIYGDAKKVTYAKRHAEIIARFGRFPHRNQLLGRSSTKEEEAFLETFSSF